MARAYPSEAGEPAEGAVVSEPLKDVRTKVNVETWALIEAESRATGKEQAEIIREVLHGWSAQRWAVINVAHQLARGLGSAGE